MPGWPYTPPGGWTADDSDRIGTDGPYGELDLLKHVELIDGALVIPGPQPAWHRALINRVARDLGPETPPDLAATSEMDVKLGPRQRPVPDVLVITVAAAADLSLTYYEPAEVRLVIEVVSEESVIRDRTASRDSTLPRGSSTSGVSRTSTVGRSPTSSSWSRPPAPMYLPVFSTTRSE